MTNFCVDLSVGSVCGESGVHEARQVVSLLLQMFAFLCLYIHFGFAVEDGIS